MKAERIALKRAFGETIRGVGGLEAAAGFCRVGKSVLGDAQNINCADRWPTLDVIADLEPLARDREGWPHVTRALCREMGGAFVLLPGAPTERGDFLRTAGELGRESADVTQGHLRGAGRRRADQRARGRGHPPTDRRRAVAARRPGRADARHHRGREMTIMHLQATVPSLGAHKLAWIIGTSGDPEGDIERFGQAVGDLAMFDRVLSGELVPGATMADAIWLWSVCYIRTRDWGRPATGWWFDKPHGWTSPNVPAAA